MTKESFDKLFDVIVEDLKATRAAGQKEYAHGEVDDVFNNFNRLSKELGIDKKQVLWVYWCKHRDGVLAYLNGHKSQREDVRGRIKDMIVYLILLWGMIEEEEASPKIIPDDMLMRQGVPTRIE